MGGYMRTGLLLAAMTGLFLAAGFLIGGQQGMVIAFAIAGAMKPVRLLERGQAGAADVWRRAGR
jgi:hypothetical protein